jgi:hypothetical protein
MNAPVAFDYFAMPKESREMSKFIMDHFFKIRPYRAGEREELNEYELKKLRDAEAERQRRSRARRRGGAMTGGRTAEEIQARLREVLEDIIEGIEEDDDYTDEDAENELEDFFARGNDEENELYTSILEHLNPEEIGVTFLDEVKSVLANIDMILTPRRGSGLKGGSEDTLATFLEGIRDRMNLNEEDPNHLSNEMAWEDINDYLDENDEDAVIFDAIVSGQEIENPELVADWIEDAIEYLRDEGEFNEPAAGAFMEDAEFPSGA